MPIASHRQRRQPVWNGPEKEGITFSLLSRYLVCKERFRLLVMDGLKPVEQFNHKIEFGSMWHTLEESLAAEQSHFGEIVGTTLGESRLKEYAQGLARKYPLQQEQVDHWYNVVKVTFPIYVQHWSKHPDVRQRTPLLQEHKFRVPYRLPSGRTVHLMGKFDAVDLVGEGKEAGVYLQENKTKSDIREGQILSQLTFDLQTMLYLVALSWQNEHGEDGRGLPAPQTRFGAPIRGVRYNVIRRPLSGGKGTIVRHKATAGAKCSKCKGAGALVPLRRCEKCYGSGRTGGKPEESKADYYRRVASYIEAEPNEYFMRWKVEVTPEDVAKFRHQCLDPALENLLDDYEWWAWAAEHPQRDVWDNEGRGTLYPWHRQRHYRTPFGLYNPMAEGGASDLDEYLHTGSEAGLTRVDNLFPELE